MSKRFTSPFPGRIKDNISLLFKEQKQIEVKNGFLKQSWDTTWDLQWACPFSYLLSPYYSYSQHQWRPCIFIFGFACYIPIVNINACYIPIFNINEDPADLYLVLHVIYLSESEGHSKLWISNFVFVRINYVSLWFPACADAYLTPCVQKYVSGFASGFKNQLQVIYYFFTPLLMNIWSWY